MANPIVLVERREHVMIVTLNRPEAGNAVNVALWSGVGGALSQAEQDDEVRAVILTGAGERVFCAGADLKALARGEKINPVAPEELAWGFAGVATHPISKPLIAAVNGSALGGGTEIALACDLVVAVEAATFGLPEVKRGLIAAAGGAFRLSQQLPPKLAMEMLLSGDPISAARALEVGLINAVVPRAGLLDAALVLAARITGNAPLSVRATKRIAKGLIDGIVATEAAAWAQNRVEIRALLKSEDMREGAKAFAEKRAPVWQGR
jgi:crotonobetainyl-CoA hydratase